MPINPYQLAEQAKKQIDTDAKPFRGGCNTVLEPEQLNAGEYSDLQNMRNMHPGLKKRPGQTRLNSTTEGAAVALNTIYQFSKGKQSEKHFYAQRSDGLIIEAGTVPPGSITGSLGSIVFTEASSPKPASWTIITDKMIFSNGVDKHQIYPGNNTPIEKFIVCKMAAAHPVMPDKGLDYSLEVLDDDTSTKATLDGIGTLADDYDCIYVMAPMPINTLNFTMGNANSTSAVGSVNYWNGSWSSVTSVTNNTSVGGCAFGRSSTITWTPPSDEYAKNQFGAHGFWYQVYLVSGSCSGVVDATKATYDASFQPIQNVWDGTPASPVECQFYHASGAYYQTQSPDAVTMSSVIPSDYIYLGVTDPIEAIYVDVGTTPNSHAASIDTVGIWCGSTWSVACNIYDHTSGLTKSGWITFRKHTSVQPCQFGNLQNYAYWYYLQVSGTSTSSNLVHAFTGQPFFSITDLGKGLVNCSWKNRACYVFDRTPNFIHVSETNQSLHINGTDSAILQAGDGRSNKIVCLRNFYNEMMAWQEEKGVDGGTLTLFEGYSPETFGKLVLSNRIGTFSAKSAVVVDGINVTTSTTDKVKTLAFFLSHYGIYMTDGRVLQCISGPIQNYFDTTQSECIRLGYEDKMWIGYDSTFNVLRIGLVSGSSATNCNVYPVYDLKDGTWGFDSLGQNLNSYIEIEAGSGNVPLIQCGGGTDGYLYRLNNGQNDVSTAIGAYVRQEINLKGNEFMVKDIKLRYKVQSAGNVSVIPYQNGVEKASFTVTMTAENTNETIRRFKKTVDILGNNIAFKYGNASASNDTMLYDIAYNIENFDGR